eukprot:6173503-Amphidinium_carterae.2
MGPTNISHPKQKTYGTYKNFLNLRGVSHATMERIFARCCSHLQTERTTVTKAPEPGPLLLEDRPPIKGKSTILNTDVAKAYKCEVEGVLHTSVRHSC